MQNPGQSADSNYGEMYIVDNVNAITINASDEWHAVDGLLIEGLVQGFTFEAGSSGVIASIADAGGGDITVTDVAHGLSVGDYITQNGCTDSAYNGLFKVLTVPSSSTYTITATYTADDSGYWQKGSNLVCDVAGIYQGSWTAAGISETNAHIFDFAPAVNTTVSSKAKSRRKFSNADYGAFSGGGLLQFAVGDKITFAVQNVGAVGDVTIRTLDLSIHRL